MGKTVILLAWPFRLCFPLPITLPCNQVGERADGAKNANLTHFGGTSQ